MSDFSEESDPSWLHPRTAVAGIGLAAVMSGLSYLLLKKSPEPDKRSRSVQLRRLKGYPISDWAPQLTFGMEGKPLDKLSLLTLEIRNTGAIALRKNDFISSLIIGSDPAIPLLSAECLDRSAPQLSVALEILEAGYHTRLHIDHLAPNQAALLGFLVAGPADTHLYLSGGKLTDGEPIVWVEER